MSEPFEYLNIKEQIAMLREKNPAYEDMLNFYEKIIDEQESTQSVLNITPIEIRGDLMTLQINEGFPLINKEDFPVDIHASIRLFESICRLGKNTTSIMHEDIQKIEQAIEDGVLSLVELLKRHYDTAYIDQLTENIRVRKAILKFLIHMSIQPSINAHIAKLKKQVNLKSWQKGYCPICGSLPRISELRGEGQRYFLCSFCGFKWPGERMMCPFCENRNHKDLQYFYAEGNEVHRVDVCNKCKHYIKTVDTRKLDYEPDLNLEDITTVHLDILTTQKGFKRPVSDPWGP
ncbi:MAG: formate dehydrogenase accessory protein FdhE [Thermodesulfovibrionales bacterium]|nr:formate dehydrogenase accessory protein FdhE [Pseudomonadota bacterium]MCG2709984.1 formate dehydrogenase accessory protein FdhE [Thermodesulfovibrionales bacterium]